MIFIFILFFAPSSAFNVDTESAYIIKSETDNLFGFSVALHKTSSASYLLVGAPKAQTAQPYIVLGGAVFKCKLAAHIGDPTEPIVCSEQLVVLDKEGDRYTSPADTSVSSYDNSTEYIIKKESKSHQWLGVTVQSSHDNSYVVGCAHRFEARYLGIRRNLDDPPRQLIGKCNVLDRELEYLEQEYQPKRDMDSGYESYGYCQSGASSFLLGKDIIIGSPGCHKGAGSVYLFDIENDSVDKESYNHAKGEGEIRDLPYTGYSTVLCDVNGDGIMDIIAGGPRGHSYRGEVSVYQYVEDDNFLEYMNHQLGLTLAGEQLGSYYGHSLACADFNGDGLDDLVVGSPWYTVYKGSRISPDTGRIYVYAGDKYDFLAKEEYAPLITIDGSGPDEAFGFSLSSAGDINTDGYMDLFVGSPYYNEGEGRVSLFLGSADGLQITPAQVISPSTISVQDNIRGFGWSIAAGKDMDNNDFPDVLVGAYKSNHAVFLRTVRIIDVIAEIKFLGTELDPKLGTMETPEGDLVPGIELQVCYQYISSGTDLRLGNGTVNVTFSLTLDSQETLPRIYTNYAHPTRKYSDFLQVDILDTTKVVCTELIPTYYRTELPSRAPIEVTLSAELVPVDTFDERAALNQQLITESVTTIKIASECPKDTGVCRTSVELAIGDPEYDQKHLYPIVIGKVKYITIPVSIKNLGPDHAYGTRLEMKIPSVLKFVEGKIIETRSKCSVTNPEDEADSDSGSYPVMCIMDDPLIPGAIRTIDIKLNISGLTAPVEVEFGAKVVVREPSIEVNASSSITTYSLNIAKLADLVIRSGSSQRKLPFNNKFGLVNKALGYEGPTVNHFYEISLREGTENTQSRFVDNIDVAIYWPQKFPNDAWLFPLTGLVHVLLPAGDTSDTGVSCDQVEKHSSASIIADGILHKPDEFYPKVSCKDDKSQCTRIKCNIEQLERGESRLKFTLTTAVQEYLLYDFQNITVESYAEILSAKDMVLPFKATASATTILYASTSKSRNLLWWIVGAVLGGLFILIILILILWKCKFFRRLKPEAEPKYTVGYKQIEDFGDYGDEVEVAVKSPSVKRKH